MRRDVARGAEPEVDAILGHVVAEGERLGVATPLARFLSDAVRAKASQARAKHARRRE